MSRGHGALERFVKERVDKYKHVHLYWAARTFYKLTEDEVLEKRHKVSVLRAAKSLAARYGYYVAQASSVQKFDSGLAVHWRGMHISTQPLPDEQTKQKDDAREFGLSQSTISRLRREVLVLDDGYSHKVRKILGMTCDVFYPPESN